MSHQWHFCLSVFTCGLWIPIWIICGLIGLIPESDTTNVTKVSEEYETRDLNNISVTVSEQSRGDHSEGNNILGSPSL